MDACNEFLLRALIKKMVYNPACFYKAYAHIKVAHSNHAQSSICRSCLLMLFRVFVYRQNIYLNEGELIVGIRAG